MVPYTGLLLAVQAKHTFALTDLVDGQHLAWPVVLFLLMGWRTAPFIFCEKRNQHLAARALYRLLAAPPMRVMVGYEMLAEIEV